jgi:hypothetical protein
MKKALSSFSKCASFTLVSLGLNVQGATITQLSSMAPGESWDTAAKWSNNLAAAAGNDYVNDVNFWVTRTTTGTTTFAGDSLTISNGARLQLQTTDGGTTTINNLAIGAGSRIQRGVGGTATLAGTMSLFGTGAVTFNSESAIRTITVDSLMSAASTIDTIHIVALQTPPTQATNTGGIVFTNANNTFSGTWEVTSSMLKGSGLGTASFNVGSLGFLDFDSDYISTAGSLTIASGGRLLLDQNLTFGSVTIAGTALAAGVYTGAELKTAAFGSSFATGSLDNVSITVIPEPSSIASLLGATALLAVLARRPRRSAKA